MSTEESFFELFRGFSGAHGTYDTEEYSADKGKQEIKRSATTKRSPVTRELWRRHLAGEYHLGIITICEDSHCWWGAVDIDDYTIDHAQLVRTLAEQSIPAVVCRTKSGGAHVYLFFSEPIPAAAVMSRLRDLAAVLEHGDSEVFPKQTRVGKSDLGNWLNMPYFDGDLSRCYAVQASGLGMSMQRFLDTAHKSRLSEAQLSALVLRRSTKGWEDAPPCLEHLAGLPGGIPQGMQNNALLGLGVLAKKMSPDNWQDLLVKWSQTLCVPPHDPDRMRSLIRSLSNKDYSYQCNAAPCVNHCNKLVCKTRRFGVRVPQRPDVVTSLSILDTNPPVFYATLVNGGVVECKSRDLLDGRIFQRLVLEQLQLMIFIPKHESWQNMLAELIESATRIEAPREISHAGELFELVEQFCTDRYVSDSSDGLLNGKPWRDDEAGRVWFRIKDLMRHLRQNQFSGELDRPRLNTQIRQMGGTHGEVTVLGRSVSIFGLPISIFQWRSGAAKLPEMEDDGI